MQIIASPTAGLRGQGNIRVVSPTQVGVTLTDREGKVHQVSLEYPQGVNKVRIGKWQLQSVNDVYVQLTADRHDLQFVRPRNGTFYVQFSKFGAEDGALPTIRFDLEGKPFQGAKWDNPARFKCFPLYEVFGAGQYDGMEIMDILTYEFAWDKNLEDWAIVGSQKRKWHDHLLTVLNVFGFDPQHDTFQYLGENYEAADFEGNVYPVANILADLEELFRRKRKIAQVTVKDGWVQDKLIIPGPFGMTRELLESAVAAQAASEAAAAKAENDALNMINEGAPGG